MDGEANPAGALVATPVYHGGEFFGDGAWMAITRIHPGVEATDKEQVGEHCHSSSLLIAWDRYSQVCRSLPELLPEQQVEEANSLTDIRIRHSASAFRIGESATPARSQLGFAIAGAVASGTTLRLDCDHASSEQEFLEAMAFALFILPEAVVPHVSFSSGWCWPDDDVQIAWSPNMGGYLAVHDNLEQLAAFGCQITGIKGRALEAFVPSLPRDAFVYLGRLMPCWRNAGLHRHIRKSISRQLVEWADLDASVVSEISSGGGNRSVPDVARNDFEDQTAEIFPEHFRPEHSGSLQAWEKSLANWLAGFSCLNSAQLKALADCEPARQAIIRALSDDRRDLHDLLETSLCLSALKRGHATAEFRRLAGAFLPDGQRLFTSWSDFRGKKLQFSGLMERITASPGSISVDTLRQITAHLCATGRTGIVTETLLSMTRSLQTGHGGENYIATLNAAAAIMDTLKDHAPAESQSENRVVNLFG
ncbi:hypothetical protein [Hoeflea sp.]|uniref:hypothetical protein n=1 Tax=Hoeflea sp. TaxID=1940281 RepID=UPI0037489122